MGMVVTVIVVSIAVLLVVDICFIEPNRLIVQSYELEAEGNTDNEQIIKVVQFSDVHLGKHYGVKELKKVVDKINSLSPDIIVCTGDLIDDGNDVEQVEDVIEQLESLDAAYGKYAVYGNHEYRLGGDSIYRKMMRESGFNLLVNESEEISTNTGKKITILGIDDWAEGEPSIEFAMQQVKSENYNIFLAHEPDVVEKIMDEPIDLQLSGHSHGGQIRMPLIGALYTPKFAKKYVKGLYEFKDSRVKLYVNTGTGSTIIKGRFLNPPEISEFMITL